MTHVTVEHAEQVVQHAPAPVSVAGTLPRDVTGFTGREDELERLTRTARLGEVVVIHTVDGMPGIGKTALATRAAHLLAPRFPDGQHFIRLHAHSLGRNPSDPSDALAVLLASRGIAPQAIPAGLDERAAMWRDHAATKKLLLVLDDASDTDQIEPLLPASPGCLVLVTSRRRLIALDGADPMPLDTLPPDQAALLFTRLAGRTPAQGEDEAVEETVRLCGYLPLAIALLAGRLAHHPTWTITAFAVEFAAAQDRLGELEAGNRAVTAAFDLSYQDLPPQRQRLFTRLGIHPGNDIDAYAAAALDDIPLNQARRELRALYTDHLIDEPAPGRYRLHDLIHTYARTKASSDPGRHDAEQRILDYYQHTSLHADALTSSYTRPQTPTLTTPAPQAAPTLATQADGMAWLRTERANLIAAITHAKATRQRNRTIALSVGVTALLRQDGPWGQAAALHREAATMANQHTHPLDQANALNGLGVVWRLRGDYEVANTHLEQALALYREIGSALGEANTLNDLGILCRLRGDYHSATTHQEQALTLHREISNRLGEAVALNELGTVWRLRGDYYNATTHQEQALALYREISNPLGEANTLNDLGILWRLRGDYEVANTHLGRALTLHQEIGNRYGEAITLNDLGILWRLRGDYEVATAHLQQGLTLHRDVGHRYGEANALYILGIVWRLRGDYDVANTHLEQALTLYREIGNALGEANTLNELGILWRLRGDFDNAATHQEQALTLHREIGHRLGEANTLKNLGTVWRLRGDFDNATTHQEQALTLHREIGHRLGEAAALNELGILWRLRGDYDNATTHQEQALTLHREIGHRNGEAEVLNELGRAFMEARGPAAAMSVYQEALKIARALSLPLEGAQALEGIARCHAKAGNPEAALVELREALTVYRRLGVLEERDAAGLLAELEGGSQPGQPV